MNSILSELVLNKYYPTSKYITSKLIDIPEVAVIAGSGIAGSFDNMKITNQIFYSEIPNMPKPTVEGHKGEVFIYNSGVAKALVFSGRFHYYEGRSIDEICSLVIITYLLGIKKIVITNAAGGLNPKFRVGDIMLIDDVIDFMFLKSANIEQLLNQNNYNIQKHLCYNLLHEKIKSDLVEIGISLQNGVYAAVSGPNYETRAEIRMLRRLGADAVGMSTAPEFKLARILEMEIIASSLITNTAKEVFQSVTHDEVIGVANNSVENLRLFIETVIK